MSGERTSPETETLAELEQHFMHVLDGWEEDSSSPTAISVLQYALGAVRDAMHLSRNAERCPTCKMTEEGYKRNLSWAGCTDRWHAGLAPSPDLWSAIRQRDANINGAFSALNAIEAQLHEMRSLKGWRLNLIRENLDKAKSALRALTSPDTSSTDRALGRNWVEDASHENGNYECRCVECGDSFIGHKRRVLCKLCSNLLKVSDTSTDREAGK